MAFNYNNIASIIGGGAFQESAIILAGPPIEIFAQRGAPTIILKPLRQSKGKFYYECKTATAGFMQIGWCDEGFGASATEGKGCGDDAGSWGFDGKRCLKWHDGKQEKYGELWSEGDILGIAADLDKKEIFFACNGKSLGKAFEKVDVTGAIYPCISLARGQRVQLFLGNIEDPFNYQPPEGFAPLKLSFPVENTAKEDQYNKFASDAKVINMSLAEKSFNVSFPGEMMVKMMGRGLDYEAKKNAMIHAGYQETLKKWKAIQANNLLNLKDLGLSENEAYAVICYTLEKPPVYRFFNGGARKGYCGDGMDFPVLTHLLQEACRKILLSTPKPERTKTVYRGVSLPFGAEVGQKVRFGSYTSTTSSKNVAESFQRSDGGTQFVIETKIGAPIRSFSAFPEEEEVLLPPYEVYRVSKVVEKPLMIYMESVFDDEFVDRYVDNSNAVYEANDMAQKVD